MLNRGDTATLWGIERARGSRLEGKLVVPSINVWQTVSRRRINGKLPRNTPVKILKSKRAKHDGCIYYCVSGVDAEGQPVKGYVPHTFIKEHKYVDQQ
jgi:hypothetical protein